MDLLVTILIGLGVGTLVELLLPGHNMSELVLAMLLGVAGALVCRFVGHWLGWFGGSEPAGYLGSVLGAVLTLVLYGAFFRRTHGRR
jgi:uncharacterized membrane protein YeaQ/YmgE (transglycosylase-associated protein family)